ncbi:MAG: hypothetical protein M3O09_05785 [Acidobacteriota bacterium]|nr:hypothetical protein [Acidobacteriota bacterium]
MFTNESDSQQQYHCGTNEHLTEDHHFTALPPEDEYDAQAEAVAKAKANAWARVKATKTGSAILRTDLVIEAPDVRAAVKKRHKELGIAEVSRLHTLAMGVLNEN